MRHHIIYILTFLLALVGCRHEESTPSVEGFLLSEVGYPQAILYDGTYYFTHQSLGGERVDLFATTDLNNLAEVPRRTLWSTEHDGMTHIWSPEIYRIDGKWYVYFEADDGNTDNHQLYVMECADADPMTGTFVMKGPIQIYSEWNYAIHPNILQLPDGRLYLLWSGWPKRRTETETQCIYIARMENPWTTATERVMISKPDYEWERQWINPDGRRSAYPIYVNENPEAFLSPDGKRVIVLYSASGIWTTYTTMGMLTAPASANLLDSAVWTKHPEPVIPPDTVTYNSITNVYLVPSVDSTQTFLLYELKRIEDGNIVRDTYMKTVEWSADGLPRL